VCNLSATDAERRISTAQARALVGHVGKKTSFRTVVIYSPDDHIMGKAARTAGEFDHCLMFPQKGIASLLEIASLIEGAFCVLTPDTAIIHFASAAKTPVLGFYAPHHAMKEWLPFHVVHDLLMAAPGQPVSSIPIEQMLRRTDEFLEKSRIQFTTLQSSPSL
jgi:ADP-heptose:LPS heptosyltransferase